MRTLLDNIPGLDTSDRTLALDRANGSQIVDQSPECVWTEQMNQGTYHK